MEENQTNGEDQVLNTGTEEIEATVEPTQEDAPIENTNVEENIEVVPQEETKEIVDKNQKQLNYTMTKMRHEKAEALERANQEAQRVKALIETAKLYGFDGKDADEVIDSMRASYLGKSVEEVRAERVQEQQKQIQDMQKEQELTYYRTKEVERQMKEDLSKIKKINPEIKSLDDLGTPFLELLSKGLTGVQAYRLMEMDGLVQKNEAQIEQETIKKIKANSQAAVGSLTGAEPKQKTYATMSKAEFEEAKERAKRGELMGG
jgi:hypothetical protein